MTEMLRDENEYLSDLQLEALIAEVEAEDLVEAPAYITDSILSMLAETETEDPPANVASDANDISEFIQKPPKIIEFRNYCIRVAAITAATVALVLIIPSLKPQGLQNGLQNDLQNSLQNNLQSDWLKDRQTEVPPKETLMAERESRSKEDLINRDGFLDTVGSSDFIRRMGSDRLFR